MGLVTRTRPSTTPAFYGLVSGRRRDLGNAMALLGATGGVLAVLGSCLAWVTYAPGGDSAGSGLHGGAFGIYTLAIAVLLIITSFLSASMNWRLRFALVATGAAARLVVAIASWHHAVTLDNGAVVHGHPGLGLVLAAGAFATLFVVAAGMRTLDWSAAKAI